MNSSARRGRRPGSPDTRAMVLAAARESFAAAGFVGTTVRGVAAAAGVDAALVHHYFGSKHELFVAAVELPLDPRERLNAAISGDADGVGERLVRTVLGAWDDPELQERLIAVVRSSLAPDGERLLSEAFIPAFFAPVLLPLMPDHPEKRLTLIVSQVLGMLLSRYILSIEPIASLPSEEVVAAVGPTIQRYCTGALD